MSVLSSHQDACCNRHKVILRGSETLPMHDRITADIIKTGAILKHKLARAEKSNKGREVQKSLLSSLPDVIGL